jgi:hypothetical protein
MCLVIAPKKVGELKVDKQDHDPDYNHEAPQRNKKHIAASLHHSAAPSSAVETKKPVIVDPIFILQSVQDLIMTYQRPWKLDLSPGRPMARLSNALENVSTIVAYYRPNDKIVGLNVFLADRPATGIND